MAVILVTLGQLFPEILTKSSPIAFSRQERSCYRFRVSKRHEFNMKLVENAVSKRARFVLPCACGRSAYRLMCSSPDDDLVWAQHGFRRQSLWIRRRYGEYVSSKSIERYLPQQRLLRLDIPWRANYALAACRAAIWVGQAQAQDVDWVLNISMRDPAHTGRWHHFLHDVGGNNGFDPAPPTTISNDSRGRRHAGADATILAPRLFQRPPGNRCCTCPSLRRRPRPDGCKCADVGSEFLRGGCGSDCPAHFDPAN